MGGEGGVANGSDCHVIGRKKKKKKKKTALKAGTKTEAKSEAHRWGETSALQRRSENNRRNNLCFWMLTFHTREISSFDSREPSEGQNCRNN